MRRKVASAFAATAAIFLIAAFLIHRIPHDPRPAHREPLPGARLVREARSGIDTVDIWAFKNGLAPGTFVCRVTSFATRTDIGAAFGNSRFNNTGYSCSVTGASVAGTLILLTDWAQVVSG